MEKKVEALIQDIKKHAFSSTLGRDVPDETVNAWWVIARLQEILLEGK